MHQDELKRLEGDNDNLGKQNNKLLITNNPSAKAQYLNQQRELYNQSKKENFALQEEAKSTKRRLEDVNARLISMFSEIRSFGDSLSKVCSAPAQCLKVKGDINVSEYFGILLAIVRETISKNLLQLESLDNTRHETSAKSQKSQDINTPTSGTNIRFQFNTLKPTSGVNQENFNHSNQQSNNSNVYGLPYKVNHQIAIKAPNAQAQNLVKSNNNFNSFQNQAKGPESRGRQQIFKQNPPTQQIQNSSFKLNPLHLSRARDKSNNSGMDIDS